jgi:hypothetical protein
MHSKFCRPPGRRIVRAAGGRKKFKLFTRNATTKVYTLSTAQDEILAQRLLVSAQKILVAALGNDSYPGLRIWIEMT